MLDFARADRGADAAVREWRMHDLHRTCASDMAELGIPAAQALNHIRGHKAGVAGIYNLAERGGAGTLGRARRGLVTGRSADKLALREFNRHLLYFFLADASAASGRGHSLGEFEADQDVDRHRGYRKDNPNAKDNEGGGQHGVPPMAESGPLSC